MDECVLSGAPNWFLSSISSGSEAGLYAFGAKNRVYVYDINQQVCGGDEKSQTQSVVEGGEILRSFKMPRLVSCYWEHEQKVCAVCLSPDPALLLCCSSDETIVKLWDILTKTTILSIQITTGQDKISCMTWSPCDTDLVLTGSEKGVIVFLKLKSNTVTSFQPHRDAICSIKASPHSAALVAVGYRSSGVYILNIADGQPRILQKLRGVDSDVTSICWCPVQGENIIELAVGHPGTLIAAAGGKVIKIWDSTTGNEAFYKKLFHQGAAMRHNFQDQLQKKQWLDIKWSKTCPEYLISSSAAPFSDLLLWDLRLRPQQEPEVFDTTSINKHMKVIFNVTLIGDKICTFSLDRNLALWDLKTRKGLVSWCSFGGYPYCIRASPVDSGMVAIGAGDNTIRVWNQNNRSRPVDVTSLCYGARTMITSVAWHPHKEGLLAYGTEEGRVGIINTLSLKPPLMSSSSHRRTVYNVCWGPPLLAVSGSHYYEVYSLGDGTILQHFITISESGNKREAVNLIEAIQAANGTETTKVFRSEIAWRRDYTSFAVGSDDGSLNVYTFPGLKQVFGINIHSRMINCMRWHPEKTAESIHESPCRNWLAFAGNDREISIVDLPSLFVNGNTHAVNPTVITEAFCQLQGHLVKTTDLCWSPHHDGRLVSVGYDRTAVVWNVKTGEGLASYNGHDDRILTVQWSFLDPDLIISGGCDFSVRVWKVSAQSKLGVNLKDRKKKKWKAASKSASALVVSTSSVSLQEGLTASEQEIRELQDLLFAKQKQLLSQLNLETDAKEVSDADSSVNEVPDNCHNSVKDVRQLSPLGFGKELVHQSPRESPDVTLDLAASTSIPTIPLSSGVVLSITAQDDTAVNLPSTVGTSRTSRVPWKHEGQTPSEKSLAPISCTSTLPNGDQNENRNNGYSLNQGDEGLNTTPSVTDLVAPVRPLFPKPEPVRPVRPLSEVDVSSDIPDKPKKQKVKTKTLFPVTTLASNKCKAAQHEDLLDLSRIIAGQGCAELIDNKPHLGLYTDRLGAHRCLLQESEHHLNNENMEYHLQLELWRGNVEGAIQIARQRNELSDWIVSMAPLASHDLWELVSAEYAEQLEDDGQYHKAATYLLAAHKVHQAIEMFRRHKLFKEAISLARVRLSPIDPVLEDLYTDWGQNLMRSGQYELAAKCYLAMRQVQEAARAVTRRHDQSSLKTACHMTLLANEKEGLDLAFKLFSQFLVMGEWQQARRFISEHESLKILKPILYVHELLNQHLGGLCPALTFTSKEVTPDMFSRWEQDNTLKKKTELPEFLLDRSEVDTVVPWEPFLIGEHSFPHHVLRGWYHHLDVTMVTQELKALHAAISKLAARRHGVIDVPNLVVTLSVDITLCLLALLASQTSSAILHLLKALSALQRSTQHALQQALCRLMLPQGPKYLLKLQREFNAARVLITMESDGDMDSAGGEQHNSIKKYLTDIKDDSAISMSGVRCRELDCLRAYCYLAILDYLREKDPCAQNENDSLDGMPNGNFKGSQNSTISSNGHRACPRTHDELNRKMDNGLVEENCRRHPLDGSISSSSKSGNAISNGDGLKIVLGQNLRDLDQNGTFSYSESSSAQPVISNMNANQTNPSSSSSNNCHKRFTCDSSPDRSVNTTCYPDQPSQELAQISKSSSQSLLPELSITSSSVDPSMPSNRPVLRTSLKRATNGHSPSASKSALSHNLSSFQHNNSGESPEFVNGLNKAPESLSNQTAVIGHLNYLNLLRLSKGILWDIQAKREALTETLGFVHQAISQHLLLHRSAHGNNQCDPGIESLPLAVNSNVSLQQILNGDAEEDGGCSRTRILQPLPPCQGEQSSFIPSYKSEKDSDTDREHTTGICDNSGTTTTSLTTPDLKDARSLSPQPTAPLEEADPENSLRSLSDNYLAYQPPLSSPSQQEQSVAFQVEQELLGPISSEPIAFHKSRKVLWMDGRDVHEDEDVSSREATFQISKVDPDGCPIPLEWDGLPVDIKYTMPYVSLALLKQEQESISQDLKRVPDASSIPFPATAASVKKLLQSCLRSPHLSQSEKNSYVKQLNDWATLFAVTSHQQTEMEALFAATMAE